MGVSERFRIGRLAREAGRSVHAIRWYERQGLMPGVERDSAGRRVYSSEHVSWLRFLERLQRAGMSLREMKSYAALVRRGRASIGERMELLAAQQRRTAALIAELEEAQRLIARKQAYYRKWRAEQKWPGPFEVEEAKARDPSSGTKSRSAPAPAPRSGAAPSRGMGRRAGNHRG